MQDEPDVVDAAAEAAAEHAVETTSDACSVDLSVVVPAFNEAERLESALDQVVHFLSARGQSWELIVVDDGSSDSTGQVAAQFFAARSPIQGKLLRLPSNQGKGSALKAGVAVTRGRYVLMMDADLSTPIAELETLFRAIEGGAKVAIGSRALATSDIQRPQSSLRVLLGRTGNLWIRALAVPGIHDTQCGFKLMEGPLGRRLFALCRQQRFGIDIELLCLARRRFHVEIAEVGIRWVHCEGSKVKWRDYLDVLLGVPRIVWSVMRLDAEDLESSRGANGS